jgi:hypothetical protein
MMVNKWWMMMMMDGGWWWMMMMDDGGWWMMMWIIILFYSPVYRLFYTFQVAGACCFVYQAPIMSSFNGMLPNAHYTASSTGQLQKVTQLPLKILSSSTTHKTIKQNTLSWMSDVAEDNILLNPCCFVSQAPIMSSSHRMLPNMSLFDVFSPILRGFSPGFPVSSLRKNQHILNVVVVCV